MSGIEVAGLVLGALPLFVSALESWRGTKDVIDNFWEYRSAHQKCLDDLLYCKYIFTSNLEELLLPLVCNEEEANFLLADPGNSGWREPELEERLKSRLGDGFDHYLRAMGAIKDLLHELKNDLGLERLDLKQYLGQNPAEPLTVLNYINVQVLKVKFALGKPPREDLFKKFEGYNERLEKLLRKSDNRQQIKGTLKAFPRSLARSINLSRKRAATLYTLLAEAWSCDCKCLHQANLELKNQINDDSCSRFNVLFVNGSNGSEADSWTCKDTSIIIIDRPPPKLVVASTSILQPPSTSKHGRFALRKKLNSVTVSGHQSGQNSSTKSSTATVEPRIPPSTLQSATDLEIQDLCSILASDTSSSTAVCCGILKDGSTNEHYQLFPQNTDMVPVSLRSLLEGNNSMTLSRRQRYYLASTLALSYLSFSTTPWQPESQVKDCIVFFKHTHQIRSLALDRPCLAKKFQVEHSVLENDRAIESQALIRLGILLLELCFGSILEVTPTRKQFPVMENPKQDQVLDYAAALEWSTQVLEEAGPLYATAIDWCLKIGPSCVNTSDDWQAKVHENVVRPLQECSSHLR